MAAFDILNIIDFTPLEKIGVGRNEGVKFLVALAPFIEADLQKKIMLAFTDDEMEKIGEEAKSKGIAPEDGKFFLEEKYQAKTGNYFMDEMRVLFDEYIKHAVDIIEEARRNTDTFTASGDGNVQKFNYLMAEEKWEEAAKLLDDTVNAKSS
jgi:hypothetical protein